MITSANTKDIKITTDSKNIPLLHCLKMFAAFLIVMLHTNTIHPIIYSFCDIGVPIFLLTTGYFLPDKEGIITAAKLKKTIIKLLKLIISFQLLYLISYIIIEATVDKALIINKLSGGAFWLKLILFGNQICGPLWYLTAVAEALMLIYLFEKTSISKHYWIIIVLGLSLNIFLNEFRLVWNPNIPALNEHKEEIVRNVLIMALPFILLGVYIRRKQDRFPGFKFWMLSFIISVFCLYLEYTYLVSSGINHYCNLHISTILITISIFMVSITATLNNSFPSAKSLSKHSSNIYFFHILILNILVIAIPIFSVIASTRSILVFTATLIFSYLYELAKTSAIMDKLKLHLSIQRTYK